MGAFLRRGLSAVAFSLLASFSSNALADDKRPDQDYGRPKEGTDAGDVVAWPARVVLFPLFVVNEFILRRPVGLLVTTVEKHRVIENVRDFFTFGERNQVTIYPSALFDFGLLPSVGFNYNHEHFLFETNKLAVHFGTWGFDWLSVKAQDVYSFSEHERFKFTGQFWRRRDNPFFGIGPRSRQDDWTRYGSQTVSFAPEYEVDFGSSSSFETMAGFRGLDFFDGTCCGDTELGDYIRDGRLPSPPGFGRDYYGGFQRIRLTLDSRKERPASGSGLRADMHEESMFDATKSITGESARSWIRYGGAVGAAWDITGFQRVLGVTVDAELVDPIQGQVPFTELISLGGKGGGMPGYIRNRLVDRSALVATLQYSWPVWVFLDGVLQVAAGNVWGERFNNFELKAQRLSGSIGVRSNGDRDSGFEFTVGAGTEPLDQGFNVSSFRFLIGSHHGL